MPKSPTRKTWNFDSKKQPSSSSHQLKAPASPAVGITIAELRELVEGVGPDVAEYGGAFVGNRVGKFFNGSVLFLGTVTAFDKLWWHVVYDDGDEEEYDWKDLKAGLEKYTDYKEKEQQESSAKAKKKA
jgi:hypothetical protein